MQYYVLKDEVGSSHETKFSEMPPVIEGKAPTCPACGVCVGSIPTLPPYRAELKAYGKQLGDLAFGPGDNLLVSDRFRQAWEGAHLRGLVFTPLERVRVRPARLGKKSVIYFHVAPRLFGTQVDVARSLIEYDLPITCAKCKSGSPDTVRGFAIDEQSWTGEDIFELWGLPGSIIVTDRVRQLRDEHSLTNINLTPVEQYFWDPYNRWSVNDLSPPDWYKPDEDSDDEPAPDA